jgi:hypothetical protein
MRTWLVVLILAFQLYSFFDCARTEQDQFRTGPKWVWLISIFLFGLLGSIAWFVWGRPKRQGGGGRGPRKIIPPDDDPDFLRKI